jgi:hypothetical protein
VAFPDVTGKRAGRFLILGCNRRHVKIPLNQAPGMPGRDIPVLLLYRCFYQYSPDNRRSLPYNPQNSGTYDTCRARFPFSYPWS